VVVAQEQHVEVHRRFPEQPLCVPVGVGEGLEQSVGDERGVVGVRRRELVVEVRPSGAGHEVETVERRVPHLDRLGPESGRQSQVLEQVEPLGVAFCLVVADYRQKRNARPRKIPECRYHPLQVDQPRTPVVEQVPGVDDGVDIVGDRVRYHLLERGEKVPPTLGRVILPVADVRVAGVDHPCHLLPVGPTACRFKAVSRTAWELTVTVLMSGFYVLR